MITVILGSPGLYELFLAPGTPSIIHKNPVVLSYDERLSQKEVATVYIKNKLHLSYWKGQERDGVITVTNMINSGSFILTPRRKIDSYR